MNETFMKEKPILPLLTSMALPMVISMMVNALYNIVDSLFVARINENAMTALSLVFPIQNFVNALAIGFGVGINALIAYFLGAGDKKGADRAATQGLVLALIHGVVVTVLSISIMPAFLDMFTNDVQVYQMGMEYAVIVFAFSTITMANLSFEKIFQSVGRMKVSMIGLLCGSITNIILDPLLIFGIGIFPRLGIAGAAIATAIGQLCTLLLYLTVYNKRPIPVKIRKEYLTFHKETDHRLYSIGVPAILNLALPSLLVSVLNGILAAYSQIYVVILGIYYKLQTFLYLPANGIVQGMRPLIGYNYGAGERKRVEQIYRLTLELTAGIMAIGTALCWLIPGGLIGLFTENPETVTIGITALHIISLGFILSAVSVTSSGALEALGQGMASLVISVMRYVAVIIPAAFGLSSLIGVTGVWWAFVCTESVTAVVAYVLYHRVWKRA